MKTITIKVQSWDGEPEGNVTIAARTPDPITREALRDMGLTVHNAGMADWVVPIQYGNFMLRIYQSGTDRPRTQIRHEIGSRELPGVRNMDDVRNLIRYFGDVTS